ncbi:hypothetical protein SE17_31780, partial [Kouleothrix aurantiaca]
MPTILLADDDVTLMERLATLLGNEGYTVLRANQVQYAELMLREQSFDLILLNPDMGRGDGWVLMGAAVASTPVIVISGQGLEEDIVRGLDAGAADYLAKPFGTAELLARMRTRLRERERMHDVFGRFVSPTVARLVLSHPLDLRGETKELTILFTDLRDFTVMSEQEDPAVVIQGLNEYFQIVVDAAERHGGIVNKFGGDSTLVLF